MESSSVDLEPGDFLYQSDTELFLVCIEEQENSYFFAAHGWRNIDKERLSEYVDGEHGNLHRKSEVDDVMEDADADKLENYRQLLELFATYTEDIDDEGPHTEFVLEDT